MILRSFAILLTGLAVWMLWIGYGNLSELRGTPFWDFRYLVFLLAAILGLSALEWAFDRVQRTIKGK